MAQIVAVTLPDESKNWAPLPFPGSLEAVGDGCTCPESQPWPGGFQFATDCPIEAHQLKKVGQRPDA